VENGVSPYQDEETDDDEEFEVHREIPALERAKTHESVVEVNKPRGELFLVTIEEAAVLGQVAIHLVVLLTGASGRRGRIAAIAELATWVYVAVLASLRLLFSSSSKWSFPRLWYHTAFIYCALWVSSSLMFRSQIIHPQSALARNLGIADFSLTSLLATIALASRKGNRAVRLEYEGDMQPPK